MYGIVMARLKKRAHFKAGIELRESIAHLNTEFSMMAVALELVLLNPQ